MCPADELIEQTHQGGPQDGPGGHDQSSHQNANKGKGGGRQGRGKGKGGHNNPRNSPAAATTTLPASQSFHPLTSEEFVVCRLIFPDLFVNNIIRS